VVPYAVILYQVKLYADMGLRSIFAGTLLYGLWHWLRGRSASGEVLVTRVRTAEVLASIVAAVGAAVTRGFLLYSHTDASLPWADSALPNGGCCGTD